MKLLVLILTTINSIRDFDLFWTVIQGGPGTATTVVFWLGYVEAFQYFLFGRGRRHSIC
jgi:ABC-type sugar transport system permease subunit